MTGAIVSRCRAFQFYPLTEEDVKKCVKAAVAEGARPEDLRHPGHVFPLRARPGGVLERRGHTEATVDLMSLAGLPPCGVLCELTNDDGTMARLPQVADFARANDLPLLAVADIVRWRERQEGRA